MRRFIGKTTPDIAVFQLLLQQWSNRPHSVNKRRSDMLAVQNFTGPDLGDKMLRPPWTCTLADPFIGGDVHEVPLASRFRLNEIPEVIVLLN